MTAPQERATFLIIGGGIAGVTCLEQLAFLNPEESITLLTASPVIKAVTHIQKLTQTLEQFHVEEQQIENYCSNHQNVQIIKAEVTRINFAEHCVYTDAGSVFLYKKLCICSGAIPNVISSNPYVIGIRDTETVQEFEKRLTLAHRIVVVGNGGIATELVYEVEGCQVVWAVKDSSIGATFFDPGAAAFFLPSLKEDKPAVGCPVKRLKYSAQEWQENKVADECKLDICGGSLGPDWSLDLNMKGSAKLSHDIHIEYGCEVKHIYSLEEFCSTNKTDVILPLQSGLKEQWPVYIELSNGKIYGCDFIVSATGVIPNSSFTSLDVSAEGGLTIDEFARTSAEDVYAAGDVCAANWKPAKHWFQMRLWTQARQMGAYAARCMTAHLNGESLTPDFCFEMFSHVTKFFGYKVVLLGLYNGQGLGKDYEILLRLTKGQEYVKVVLQEGRMQGAILIGETNLEETFENLILNQMDLSSYGEALLDPNIDIEDYFD